MVAIPHKHGKRIVRVIKMSIDSDMEIIKSAIIYGDIGDAEKVIQRRIKNLGIILKRRSRPELQEYLEFLNALDSLLRSRITLEQFKSISGGIHGLENLLERHTGEHGYLPSLFYLLQLSIDRYNVRYPEFDMKRCDDL
ncbi:MAG: hypothetical protein AMDU1_APLC00058G0027 [Thermoplasmatales archaeon A-plasma]|nr:MAG: hypothetical protein AMDU1_APLC00058G0027 [Thermoplasmatales archaeon A-plasma]